MPHRGPPLNIPQVAARASIWSCLFDRQQHGSEAGFSDAGTGQTFRFNALKCYSETLSTALACKLGIQAGDVICLFCANSIWYPVAVFAALRLGAIVSPASPDCTSSEAAHIIRTVRPKVIIVDAGSHAAITKCIQGGESQVARLLAVTEGDGSTLNLPSVQVLCMRCPIDQVVGFWAMSAEQSSHDSCALLCFTSGTTSLPKATMISHRNVIAQLYQVKAYTRRDHPEVVLGVLPFHHITGIIHLLHLPLLLGQQVVVMPKFNMPRMLETIKAFRCAELWLVPPILIRLVSDDSAGREHLESVRQINTGAAPLGREIIAKLAAQYPRVAIRQAWGMTESCSCLSLTPPEDQTYGNAHTVGKIVAGTCLRIVTPGTGDEVGIGQSGEILAKGPQIMMRYFGNEEATAEAIGPDGFLRTGDIGFVDKLGFVHVEDRLKEIIKVKGVGVAPAELEDILVGHPSIQDAAVVGIPDTYSGQVPRAYVVLQPGVEISSTTAREIQSYVKQKCSTSKWLRGGIAFVEEIPKSGSGKILRRRLQDLSVVLEVEAERDMVPRL